MSYTVAVATTYRVGCPECTSEAERIAVQGIRDKSVTSITLRAANACEHGKSETPPAPRAALLGQLDLMPHSDTNGFDPNM